MKNKIKLLKEKISNNISKESFNDIEQLIDRTVILFGVWYEELLLLDPEWAKFNSISNTYLLFKEWDNENK